MARGFGRRAQLQRFFQWRGRMSSTRCVLLIGLLLIAQGRAPAQSGDDFVPVTDAMLQEPDPADWLMWRRTLDSWGYSPLDGRQYVAVSTGTSGPFARFVTLTPELRPSIGNNLFVFALPNSPSRRAAQAPQADAPSSVAEGVLSGGSVLDGVFTSAQASRGEQTFDRVCASCHDTGEFSGGRFRLSWVGRTAGDLFDTMSTLMPEADPGSLSPDAYASLVAYLFRLNGYPAGEVALPTDLAALQRVQIVESPAP